MEEKKQQRERAYKIWEDEGREDGSHDDHWKRAEEQEVSAQDSEDVTMVNQGADEAFAGDGKTPQSAPDIKPLSSISPD